MDSEEFFLDASSDSSDSSQETMTYSESNDSNPQNVDMEFSRHYFLVFEDESPRHIYSDTITLRSNSATNAPLKGEDLLYGVGFTHLSGIFRQNGYRNLALDGSVAAWHWWPDAVVVQIEDSPGRWKHVIVLSLKQDSQNLGGGFRLSKPVISHIVQKWETLVIKPGGSRPRPSINGQLGMDVNNRVEANESLLRGRMRRRARHLGRANSVKVHATAISANIPRNTEQLSPAANGVNSMSVLNHFSRGRLRRRARRMMGQDQINSSIPRLASTHTESKVKRPVETRETVFPGWELDPSIHKGRFSFSQDSAALMKRPIHLKIGLGSSPIRLRSERGSGIALRWCEIPFLILSKGDGWSNESTTVDQNDSGSCEYALLRGFEDLESRISCCEKHRRVWPKASSPSKSETVIIAHFTDLTGLIQGQIGGPIQYGYLKSIGAHESFPELGAALRSPSYWKRIGLLVTGDARRRTLPYSKGYGITHSWKISRSRPMQYGVLDVDTDSVNDTLGLPQWRAAWSFPQPREIPDCQCHYYCRLWPFEGSSVRPPLQYFPEPQYFVHWPHEFFCHKLLGVPLNFYERWDIWRSLEFPRDLNYDVTRMWHPADEPNPNDNNVFVPTPRNTIPSGTEPVDPRSLDILSHFLGLGKAKNVCRGLQSILREANKGCPKSRGLSKRIHQVYDQPLAKDDQTVRKWLLEGASQGSAIALQDLQNSYPDSAELQLVRKRVRFSFNTTWPESLQYHEHVLPLIDFENPNSLRTLISRLKGPEGPEREAADSLLRTVWIGENRPDELNGVYQFGGVLHMACLFGFTEAVTILLDAGMGVNVTNSSKALRTPLHCALRRGYGSIAKILIKYGAKCYNSFDSSEIDKVDFPSPLHYVVYIEDEHEGSDLAELLVANGADINGMCETDALDSCELYPLGISRSVTPLRWAIIHGKSKVARTLVQLGAWFATSISSGIEGHSGASSKTYMFLETPTTNLDILQLYFDELALGAHELPPEFSQTPLGLLVSEEDSPQRRLRTGFCDTKAVILALDYLLSQQPGYGGILLWSTIRHDHLSLAQHLIDQKQWSVETRHNGLTCLQTAILYGRKDIVSLFLSRGADASAVTSRRKLTALHLLALARRDKQTDMKIMDMIIESGIKVDATESFNGLTALHVSVRNRKLHMAKALLDRGANPLIPVTDQIDLLCEGRSGLFKDEQSGKLGILEDTTILGEVLLQCNQDAFYPLKYAEKLLRLILARDKMVDSSHFYIDGARTVTILHILALLPFRRPMRIFRFVLDRFQGSININVPDMNGDSPLHYACVSWQPKNAQALLILGADPFALNFLRLTPFKSTIFASILLGPLVCGFLQAKPVLSSDEKRPFKDKLRGAYRRMHDGDKRVATTASLRRVLEILETWGVDTQHPLRELALAWCPMEKYKQPMVHTVVPLELRTDAHQEVDTIWEADPRVEILMHPTDGLDFMTFPENLEDHLKDGGDSIRRWKHF